MSKVYTAIGLMSGTSMDGIDLAIIKTDGDGVVKPTGQTYFRLYSAEEQGLISKAMLAAAAAYDQLDRQNELDRWDDIYVTAMPYQRKIGRELSMLVTRAHKDAVLKFLRKYQIKRTSVDLVGFHGQTVLHHPEQGITEQVGFATTLADELQIPVVSSFRKADVEAGGQGAPLVPVYHQALVNQTGLELPVAILNVGGVANVTYIGEDGELIAFDTGPGNALINDWVRQHGAGDMDEGGKIAAQGRVKESVLSQLLNNSYFSQEPPKSLDRNHFSLDYLDGMSLEGVAMTLTTFTVQAVTRAISFFPAQPKQWIICGGGVRNPTLMGEFQKRLTGEVLTADDLGWSSDFMEAEAFAYLAVRSLRGLPLTFPGTTGVKEPLTGGVLHMPQG